jgi:uncharacterized protein
MLGESNLGVLLKSMKPELQNDVFVFCSLSREQLKDLDAEPLFLFREKEGSTVVLKEGEARLAGLEGVFPSRWITLSVHSSLDAVGFLAAVTSRLARAGISVNAVSAYYHDHLFVPAALAQEAMRELQDLAGGTSA